jgi:hypothetical protein
MSVDDRPKRSTEDAGREEPFLARWARLKREARESATAEPAPPPEEPAVPAQAGVAGLAGPANLETGSAIAADPIDAAGPEAVVPELPSLDSLTEESNFGAFMAPGVTPELRRQALRKMFTNPKYAIVDPLDPYRADYAAFTPLGDIITSDMKFHAERLLRKQLEKDAEAAEAAGDTTAEAEPALAATEPGAPPADAGAQPHAGAEPEAAVAPDATPKPTENDDERRDG